MIDPIFTITTNDLSPFFDVVKVIVNTASVVLLAWIALKQSQLTKIRESVNQLHDSTNSKMDLLLRTVADASLAKGLLQGRAEQSEQRNEIK